MPSRLDVIKQHAVYMVAQGYQPNFYQLAGRLQNEVGASHAEANRAVMELIGSGRLRTTMSGRIVLGGGGGGGGGAGGAKTALEIVAALLGIVVAVLGIWQGAVQTGAVAGPGPIQVIFPEANLPFPTNIIPTNGGGGGGNPLVNGPKLATPTLAISGDCASGYTLTWSAVDGAENYQVRADDHFFATKSGTTFTIPGREVITDHQFTITAKALQRPDSDPSNGVTAAAC